MLVALVSIINETPPLTCLLKAVSAFIVFAGFGIIIRYALTATEEKVPFKLPPSTTKEREAGEEETPALAEPHSEATTARHETPRSSE
jgi:hypothetical protein